MSWLCAAMAMPPATRPTAPRVARVAGLVSLPAAALALSSARVSARTCSGATATG